MREIKKRKKVNLQNERKVKGRCGKRKKEGEAVEGNKEGECAGEENRKVKREVRK